MQPLTTWLDLGGGLSLSRLPAIDKSALLAARTSHKRTLKTDLKTLQPEMSYVGERQTAPVSYRAKSNFVRGLKLVGCGEVALWVHCQLCGSHAGDICEPGAMAVVLSNRTRGSPRSFGKQLDGRASDVTGHWSTCSKIQRHL